jgi:hypothetical protein
MAKIERLYKTNGLVSERAPKELIMMKKYLLLNGSLQEARDGDIIQLNENYYVFFRGDLYRWKWTF